MHYNILSRLLLSRGEGAEAIPVYQYIALLREVVKHTNSILLFKERFPKLFALTAEELAHQYPAKTVDEYYVYKQNIREGLMLQLDNVISSSEYCTLSQDWIEFQHKCRYLSEYFIPQVDACNESMTDSTETITIVTPTLNMEEASAICSRLSRIKIRCTTSRSILQRQLYIQSLLDALPNGDTADAFRRLICSLEVHDVPVFAGVIMVVPFGTDITLPMREGMISMSRRNDIPIVSQEDVLLWMELVRI